MHGWYVAAVDTTRSVVIVSGGDSISPFTTPESACSTGLAAGNTNTALRAHLLDRDMAVFTAAVNVRDEVVVDSAPGEFGAFGGCPPQPPVECTVNSRNDVDRAGRRLANLVEMLHERHAVHTVDLVGHSNGGTFARAAIRVLKESNSAVRVGSLVTLGSPWHGSVPTRIICGELPLEICRGDARCLAMHAGMAAEIAAAGDVPLAPENTRGFMDGPDGWNSRQIGVLADVPTLLVAGGGLALDGGDPEVWPFDGLVSRHSGLALDLPDGVLGEHRRIEFPVLHSIFIADAFGEPWSNSLTWGDESLAAVHGFLDSVR